MNSNEDPVFDSASRILWDCLVSLFGIVILVGLLHHFYSDVRLEGVYWFNLDKERNIPAWFSGMLFFLFGCSALAAYYWEQRRNSEEHCFRLPILWLGVVLVGLFMSLDEMTILYENLLGVFR